MLSKKKQNSHQIVETPPRRKYIYFWCEILHLKIRRANTTIKNFKKRNNDKNNISTLWSRLQVFNIICSKNLKPPVLLYQVIYHYSILFKQHCSNNNIVQTTLFKQYRTISHVYGIVRHSYPRVSSAPHITHVIHDNNVL